MPRGYDGTAATHEFVCGRTGSGKSWYMWATARTAGHTIIFNTDDSEVPPFMAGSVVNASRRDSAERIVAAARAGAVVNYVPRADPKVAEAELFALWAYMSGRAWCPVRLAIDECHLFARNGQDRGPALEVARRGRKRGIAGQFVTQRPADAAKTLVTQAQRLTIFRTNLEGPWMERYELPGQLVRQLLADAPEHAYVVVDMGADTIGGPFIIAQDGQEIGRGYRPILRATQMRLDGAK